MQGALVEAEEPLLDDFLTLNQEVMAEYFWKPAVSYLKMMGHIASSEQGEDNNAKLTMKQRLALCVKVAFKQAPSTFRRMWPQNYCWNSLPCLLQPSLNSSGRLTSVWQTYGVMRGWYFVRRARRDGNPDGSMGPVLCHGDFHMWNVAFSEGSDSAVRFFDFQVSQESWSNSLLSRFKSIAKLNFVSVGSPQFVWWVLNLRNKIEVVGIISKPLPHASLRYLYRLHSLSPSKEL